MDKKYDLVDERIGKDNGFLNANNFSLVKIDDLYCELRGEITDTSMNPYGIVHGGYIFGLADTAGGCASVTTGKRAVTLNSNINYLRPGKDTKYLTAVATCIKNGRTTAVFNVDVFDDKEKKIAQCSTTYYFI